MNWNIFSKNRNSIYGIAILSIMVFHYFEDYSKIGKNLISVGYMAAFGSIGVEIFIFLSGVCLFFSLSKNASLQRFYSNRAKRILPTYILVAVPFWIAVDYFITKTTFAHFCGDLFFLTLFTSGNRAFWYVLFCLISYLIYPIVFKWVKSDRSPPVTLIVLIAAGALVLYLPKLFWPTVYENSEVLLGRFLVFLIGAFCGKKVYEAKKIQVYEIVLLNVGIVLYLFLSIAPCGAAITQMISDRFVKCAWGITLIFWLAVLLEWCHWKPIDTVLSAIGSVSFELYLTHVAIRGVMNRVGYKTSDLSHYAVCLLLSVAATLFLHYFQKKLFRSPKTERKKTA